MHQKSTLPPLRLLLTSIPTLLKTQLCCPDQPDCIKGALAVYPTGFHPVDPTVVRNIETRRRSESRPSSFFRTARPDSSPVPNSDSSFSCAASVATPDVFEILLRYGARLENSPLHVAAASQDDEGRISKMEYLVGKGVDVNWNYAKRG